MTLLRDANILLKGIGDLPVLGSCTPGAVAAAVVRTIDRNRPEIIVNSRPLRPLLALGALSPRFSDWMIGALGITEFQRRKVTGAPTESVAAARSPRRPGSRPT